jgi:hypothetical protein
MANRPILTKLRSHGLYKEPLMEVQQASNSFSCLDRQLELLQTTTASRPKKHCP